MEIVDVFELIVNKMNLTVLPQIKNARAGIIQINYDYGHWKEKSQTLLDLSKNTAKRGRMFPLVFLVEDNEIDKGTTKYDTTSVNLLIMSFTSKDFTSRERQKKVFEPVLYPIYYELLKQMALSPYLEAIDPNRIPHTKIDRKFFGRTGIYGNEGNIPFEYVDAIQLDNLQCIINKNC